MKNIVIFGHRNTGKTYIGQKLSSILSYDFIDTDLLLEKLYLEETGQYLSYKKIYRDKGDYFFREMEKKAVFSLKADSKTVISLGGGTATNTLLHPFLQDLGTLIYLKVDYLTFFNRNCIGDKNKGFPLFSDSEESIKNLFNERTAAFNLLPSKVIYVDKLEEKEIIKEILNGIK